MKKRLVCLLMALGMCAVLCACGGEQKTDNPSKAPANSPAGSGSDVFVFQTGGKTVSINEDMADVLADLGKEKSYFEAASCAFEGLDKTYTYNGFEIVTRPDGDKDYVNSIRLTDDSAATVEGVYIGCSESDVTAAYGENAGAEGVLSYTRGNTALNFVMEGGKVVSIEYLPA